MLSWFKLMVRNYTGNIFHIYIILIFNKISDKNLQEPKRLPYLKINNDSYLFMPNVAAQYLFAKEKDTSPEENYWLEFESTILSPFLAHIIGNSSRSEALKSSLEKNLKILDKHLESNTFLIEVRKQL